MSRSQRDSYIEFLFDYLHAPLIFHLQSQSVQLLKDGQMSE